MIPSHATAFSNPDNADIVLEAIEAQLAPVPLDRLKQVVARLMIHFPLVGEHHHRFFNYYLACLKPYPEDLLCAAYQHVLRHHSAGGTPKIADFLAFMDPEMNHRLHQLKKHQLAQAEQTA